MKLLLFKSFSAGDYAIVTNSDSLWYGIYHNGDPIKKVETNYPKIK